MPWRNAHERGAIYLESRDERQVGAERNQASAGASCGMHERPPACNAGAAYFLASAMFAAARYRLFTSGQLMLRMNASRYAFRSLP